MLAFFFLGFFVAFVLAAMGLQKYRGFVLYVVLMVACLFMAGVCLAGFIIEAVFI